MEEVASNTDGSTPAMTFERAIEIVAKYNALENPHKFKANCKSWIESHCQLLEGKASTILEIPKGAKTPNKIDSQVLRLVTELTTYLDHSLPAFFLGNILAASAKLWGHESVFHQCIDILRPEAQTDTSREFVDLCQAVFVIFSDTERRLKLAKKIDILEGINIAKEVQDSDLLCDDLKEVFPNGPCANAMSRGIASSIKILLYSEDYSIFRDSFTKRFIHPHNNLGWEMEDVFWVWMLNLFRQHMAATLESPSVEDQVMLQVVLEFCFTKICSRLIENKDRTSDDEQSFLAIEKESRRQSFKHRARKERHKRIHAENQKKITELFEVNKKLKLENTSLKALNKRMMESLCNDGTFTGERSGCGCWGQE